MDIPSNRKANSNELSSLSRTPGGNNFIYGSTPGGTKIVYSREQLLSLASSPLSHTPPKGLNNFPAAMSRSFKDKQNQMPEKSTKFNRNNKGDNHKHNNNNHNKKNIKANDHDETFEMDV